METTIALAESEEAQLRQESHPLLVMAEQFRSITTDADQRAAGQYVARMRSIKKRIEEYFVEPIKRAHELHRMLTSRRRDLLDPIESAIDTVTRAVKRYERAVREEAERKAREAQQRARREAEEARRKQIEALAQAGEKRAAEDIAAAPIVVNTPEPPKRKPVVGVTMCEIWRFRVIDEAQVPREFLTPDLKKIGAYVRQHKAQAKIPGVETWVE